MKPTPLSAMLADDLLLDRVGARLDADDELGSLLLAVAHRADTPIPRATLARRVRPHRGLTVFAALGVAVSGATVAAAVELAPVPPDQASGAPHARAFLPPSLQALVLPFLSGSPFQGRLVLPFGALPGVPLDGSVTALGLPATALPSAGQLMEPLSVATLEAQLDKQEHDDQQDAQRQKVQAKGTPATGQGQTPAPADDQGDDEPTEPVEAAPEPKPKPTPTPTSTPTSGATNGTTNGATGQANGAANGQANGAGNGQGHGRGAGGTPTGDPTGGTGETTGDTTGSSSSGADGTGTADDDPTTGAPAKGKAQVKTLTGAPVVAGTTGATTGTTAGAATPAPTSTAATTASTSAGDSGAQ